MAYEHKSGLPFAYDRAEGHDEQKGLVFHGERPLLQAPELNELQTILRGAITRVGRMIARDGTRIKRASAVVNVAAGTVTLTEGEIYVAGDVYSVEEAVLTGVPMTGRLEIGVRLTTAYRTAEDDPSLLGIVPGSVAEGEPGAAREIGTIVWAHSLDSQPGPFFSVYTLDDGTILDQSGPAVLAPAMQIVQEYDRPNGNYIVSGCRVTALGLDAGVQHFSIEQGEANVNGLKRTRYAALRHAEPEDWDELAIPGETLIYPGGASFTFTVDFAPIAAVNSILLTKERTVTITRGAIVSGVDALPDTSVISVSQVKQGATIFAASAYQLANNNIDWAPAGAEPAVGSSYDVTYRYRSLVTPSAQTYNTITVTGGATGGDVIVSYTAKLPRIDRMCLKDDGSPVYLKGISAWRNPLPPAVPSSLLNLCQIRNDWISKPVVKNDGTYFLTRDEQRTYNEKIVDVERLVELLRLQANIDRREPVAKLGMFVDPFTSDYYRDAGAAQNGAVANGMLTLAVAPTFYKANLAAPVKLDHVEEVIAQQLFKTGCIKINPYANFTPLPGQLKLDPAVDFWTISQTEWTSPETREFNRGEAADEDSPLQKVTTTNRLVDQREEQADFLRPISIDFTISGFGAGEILKSLTFDGKSVKPAGVQTANAAGVITGSFNIPAAVTAGTKVVQAVGMGKTVATAMFTGKGTIEITVMRRITTIENWTAPEPEPEPEPEPGTPSTPTPRTPTPVWGSGHGGDSPDPQAQMFAVPEVRQIVGMDFHICKIGNPAKRLILDQVTIDNGYPTTDIVAQADISMAGAVVGWKSGRFKLPVTTRPETRHAFVIKTDDNTHSVSFAALGAYDASLQKYVTQHPYVVGPRFDSVNAQTWTAHQKEALAFKLVAAKYNVLTKTVALGNFALVNASDLQVRASIEIPGPGCSVTFEIVRANGTVYKLAAGQVLKLNEFLNETVQLRAVLKGTSKLSPILFAPVQLIAGRIQTTFSYITRAFDITGAARLSAYFKAFLPAGATAVMHYSIDGGAWTTLPFVSAEPLQFNGWTERKFEKVGGLAGTSIRLKISGTGGPAARVICGDFGAGVF